MIQPVEFLDLRGTLLSARSLRKEIMRASDQVPRLVFIAASRDDPDEAKALVGMFIARRTPDLAPYAAFASDLMSNAYGVNSLPTTFFIGRDGTIVKQSRGQMRATDIRRRLDAALEH